MGERRPVIRHTQDSRCYVNSPTALLRSALPLCGAALAPRMNHRATSGRWKGPCWFGMLHERGVCQFGPGYPRLRRPTSSPRVTHLSDYSGCTMLFGSLRHASLKKCCGQKAFTHWCMGVHVCVCIFVFVPGGNNQFWAFGITMALVCQDYTNMQTGKKNVVYFAICIQWEYKEQWVLYSKYSFNFSVQLLEIYMTPGEKNQMISLIWL